MYITGVISTKKTMPLFQANDNHWQLWCIWNCIVIAL